MLFFFSSSSSSPIPENEFAKGLQRLYQSCKHSITHVNLILSHFTTSFTACLWYWLFVKPSVCVPAPHALLLHLLSGSGAGPGAECGAAAGQHHPAQPDLHPGELCRHLLQRIDGSTHSCQEHCVDLFVCVCLCSLWCNVDRSMKNDGRRSRSTGFELRENWYSLLFCTCEHRVQ